MDPNQILRDIRDAIIDGDDEEANYLLNELNDWVNRGGFEPNWIECAVSTGAYNTRFGTNYPISL